MLKGGQVELRPIEYRKLIDILTKKGFEIKNEDNEIIAIFYPPSIEEAGGETEENFMMERYYVIKFKKQDNLAYYDSTTLMEGNRAIKNLSIEEVEPWLEYILGE